MSKKGKVNLEIIFIILSAAVLGFVLVKTFAGKKAENVPPTGSGQPPTKVSIPTKTQEEIKIISEMKTGDVTISESKVDPQSLTVKLHDQVRFLNKSSKTIKVKGEGWGGVPLGPGENMLQPFNKAGTFPYSVSELNLSGQVIVE